MENNRRGSGDEKRRMGDLDKPERRQTETTWQRSEGERQRWRQTLLSDYISASSAVEGQETITLVILRKSFKDGPECLCFSCYFTSVAVASDFK